VTCLVGGGTDFDFDFISMGDECSTTIDDDGAGAWCFGRFSVLLLPLLFLCCDGFR